MTSIRYLLLILVIVVQTFAHGPYSISSISPKSPGTFELRHYLQEAFHLSYQLDPFIAKNFHFEGLPRNARAQLLRGLTYTTDPFPQLFAVVFEERLTEKVIQSSIWLIDWRRAETHFLSSTHQHIHAIDFTYQANHFELEWVTDGLQSYCPYLHHRLSLKKEIEQQRLCRRLRSSTDIDHQIDHSRTICLRAPKQTNNGTLSRVVALRDKYVASFDLRANNTVFVKVWSLVRRDKSSEKLAYDTQLNLPLTCMNARLYPVLIDQPSSFIQSRVIFSIECDQKRFYYVYFELHSKKHTLNSVVDRSLYDMRKQRVVSFLIDNHVRLALYDDRLQFSSKVFKGATTVDLAGANTQHIVHDAIHYSGQHFTNIPLVNFYKEPNGNKKQNIFDLHRFI